MSTADYDRTAEVANAASIVRDAVRNADIEESPAVIQTPYGKAVVRHDDAGADIQLPEGATVHLRW